MSNQDFLDSGFHRNDGMDLLAKKGTERVNFNPLEAAKLAWSRTMDFFAKYLK